MVCAFSAQGGSVVRLHDNRAVARLAAGRLKNGAVRGRQITRNSAAYPVNEAILCGIRALCQVRYVRRDLVSDAQAIRPPASAGTAGRPVELRERDEFLPGIYRRWPGKSALVRAAVDAHIAGRVLSAGDTGSLRGDLLAVMRAMRNHLTPEFQAPRPPGPGHRGCRDR